MRYVKTTLALLVGLTLGCNPQAAEDSETVYFEFAIKEGADTTLCAGTISHLERYAARTFEFFGVVVPAGLRIHIQMVTDVPCSDVAGACYHPLDKTVFLASGGFGEVFNTVLQHELAHAFVDRVWGQSVPFFNEGLADAISGSLASTQNLPQPVSMMLDQPPEGVDYASAARFVRFLIDSRGIDRFKRVFQASQEKSQDKIRANFVEIYDEDFEAIEVDYLSKPRHCLYLLGICDPLFAEPVSERWADQFAASCEDPDFYGVRISGSTFITAQRTIVLQHSGRYMLRTSPEFVLDPSQKPRMSQVLLTKCGECDKQYEWLIQEEENEVELAAGMYTFSFTPAGDSVVTIDLEYLGP